MFIITIVCFPPVEHGQRSWSQQMVKHVDICFFVNSNKFYLIWMKFR